MVGPAARAAMDGPELLGRLGLTPAYAPGNVEPTGADASAVPADLSRHYPVGVMTAAGPSEGANQAECRSHRSGGINSLAR